MTGCPSKWMRATPGRRSPRGEIVRVRLAVIGQHLGRVLGKLALEQGVEGVLVAGPEGLVELGEDLRRWGSTGRRPRNARAIAAAVRRRRRRSPHSDTSAGEAGRVAQGLGPLGVPAPAVRPVVGEQQDLSFRSAPDEIVERSGDDHVAVHEDDPPRGSNSRGNGLLRVGWPSAPTGRSTTRACDSRRARWSGNSPRSRTTSSPAFPVRRRELSNATVPGKYPALEIV